ncbi:uncharacterized protein LOC129594741 [Paramacrobiotus metropolitanus]|uniref:uncharacterized protein LOC129594741 n=1 Tax=Paramacrobiotus metropolitanus TaxID=2943436 RepID=UPI002445BA41|nr:uncharacterized protein LOC129594741 [Paramacrobiotus metropolitanus]
MEMAQNIMGALAPNQQNAVKSNWSELLNVFGGNKENVAMELAKHTVQAQLTGGGEGGGLGGILSGVKGLFGKKKDDGAAAAPSNPMDIVSKVAPLIGGLDNPNALLGFFMKGALGGGQAENKSENSIFKMLKQIIFGLLGQHLPAQSFGANQESQGAWTKFAQLAAGAIKNQSWTK